jgi:hypothetical protein
MTLSATQKALIAKMAETEEHVANSGGNFERSVPPEGKTVARFIEYIDLGSQPRPPYQGKEREPAETVRLVFELLAPNKNIHEREVNGETVKFADRITLSLNKSFSDKAKYLKLFEKMKYGRQNITHMAQMLGEAFVVTITHNASTDPKNKTVYANITDSTGAYTIESPFITDPIENTVRPIPVPEALSPIRLFSWEHPSKSDWDSLYIAGTATRKDASGQEQEYSKNWIQERILGATNFNGSPLQQLLEGSADLEDVVETVQEDVLSDEPKPKKQPKKPVAAPVDDELAALGLDA